MSHMKHEQCDSRDAARDEDENENCAAGVPANLSIHGEAMRGEPRQTRETHKK